MSQHCFLRTLYIIGHVVVSIAQKESKTILHKGGDLCVKDKCLSIADLGG